MQFTGLSPDKIGKNTNMIMLYVITYFEPVLNVTNMYIHVVSRTAVRPVIKPILVSCTPGLVVPHVMHAVPLLLLAVEGKSSVCVMCMKYRRILISIIISLGQILLSYISHTAHAL